MMADVVERVLNGAGRVCCDAERNTVMDAIAAYEHRVAAEAEAAQLLADEENRRQAALAEEERIAVFLDELEQVGRPGQ